MNRRSRATYTRLSLCAVAVWLVVGCGQLAMAQGTDPSTDFLGSWEGEGTLFGVEAKFSMAWERVLEGQFVRLTFENRMVQADGAERVLRAIALYKPSDQGQWKGTWFDSRGMVLPLKGQAEAAELRISWGTPDTEQGRTVYRLLDSTTMEVDDFVLRDGEFAPFGHAVYRRLENPS